MSNRNLSDRARPGPLALLGLASAGPAVRGAAGARVHDRAERLRRVSHALVGVASTEGIARAITPELSDTFGARLAALALLVDDDSTFEMVDFPGASEAERREWSRFPNCGALPFPHVVRTREPLFINSRAEYAALFPQLGGAFASYGLQASAILPLISGDRVLGALSLEFNQPRTFREDERELLITIASQIALALDHVRVLDAEQAVRAAQEASRAKSDFIAVMSHELRTPINAISGYVDLMLAGVHGPLPDAYAGYAQRIKSAEKHLLRLIDSVLRFARLESGQTTYAIETCQVADLLQAIEPLVAPQAAGRRVTLTIEAVDPTLAVHADGAKATQILLNLVGNAINYTEPEGTIVVNAVRAGHTVAIRVLDTGRGIPEDRLDRIFVPYVRLATGPEECEGVGLGLAISRNLAHAMGGELEVSSVVGQGSNFTLRLPSA